MPPLIGTGASFYSMSAMANRTVEVSSKEVENAIQVLSSAGHAFQMTLSERFSCRALIVSADVALASFSLYVLCDYLFAIWYNQPIELLGQRLPRIPITHGSRSRLLQRAFFPRSMTNRPK